MSNNLRFVIYTICFIKSRPYNNSIQLLGNIIIQNRLMTYNGPQARKLDHLVQYRDAYGPIYVIHDLNWTD